MRIRFGLVVTALSATVLAVGFQSYLLGHNSKTPPEPITGTEGEPDKAFYFVHSSDVDDEVGANQLPYRHFLSVENKSDSNLLTADWQAADIFVRRLSPGSIYPNEFPSAYAYEVGESRLKYGETLSHEKPAKLYAEIHDKPVAAPERVASRLHADLDHGEFRFDFRFTSTYNQQEGFIEYTAALGRSEGEQPNEEDPFEQSAIVDRIGFAIPSLTRVFGDQVNEGWAQHTKLERYPYVYLAHKGRRAVARIRVSRVATLQTVSSRIVLFNPHRDNEVIAAGRVAIHLPKGE